MSDEDIRKLRAGLSSEPEWMRTCFEIALYTGCRFSECEIPMENIDLTTGTIRLRDASEARMIQEVFHSATSGLRELAKRLKESGRRVTCELSRDKWAHQLLLQGPRC